MKFPLDKGAPFYVAGHTGMVGSAIIAELKKQGFKNLITIPSSELDLRNRDGVFGFLGTVKPKYAIVAAAKVGGILANDTYPANFLSDNLQIQVNLMDAASSVGVERLLFLGSSCIYPKFAKQPISEDQLLSGPLEPTNDAYAIAKIAGIKQVQAIRKQFGLNWISAMPSNLYGPGDNYTESLSHVIPALIRRYESARVNGMSSITNWGTGTALREFLFSTDLAKACLFLLENYSEDSHINIGTGREIAIKDLAELIAKLVGYEGEVVWDTSKPDGTPRKLLDVSKLKGLGWESQTELEEGLTVAIADFRSRFGDEL